MSPKLATLLGRLRARTKRTAPALSAAAGITVEPPRDRLDTTRLADPELLAWVGGTPAPDHTPELVAGLRAAMAEQVRTTDPDADGLPLRVSTHIAPGYEGEADVRIRVVTPTGDRRDRPGILHIHGGGFILGSADLTLPSVRPVAAALDCIIASVDYRLAPEAPFPAGLNDCYAALAWFAAQAPALGVDATRIAVMGESAGGGLAAALALLARDRGGPALAFQSLLYPMLDDRTVTEVDPNPVTGQFIWNRASNRYAWETYLDAPPGSDPVSPYAAPARASDLSRLPPAHILVGTLDLFFDEDLEFARRLARAAVPVALDIFPGAFHAFDMMYPAAVSKDVQARRRTRLAQALAVDLT